MIFDHLFSEIKHTLKISLPIVASQLIYALSTFIAVAMTAHLGEAALAASILVSVIWSLLIVLALGVLYAVSILVAHQHGAHNEAAISDIMGQSYLLGLIVTVITTLLLFSSHLFLPWSHQPAPVLTLAYQYIHALILTVPSVIILVILEQFLLGIGRTKLVLLMSLLIVPLDIPLMYGLIFGKWGFPRAGVAGVGYSLAISNSIVAVLSIIYLVSVPTYHRYQIFKNLGRFNARYLKELFRVGLPISIMQVIEVSTFLLAAFWIAQFGTRLLAAHQLVSQYQSLIITFVFAMSQAVTIRVGHAVGREDLPAVKHAAYTGIALNFVLMLLIVSFFNICPQVLLQIDIDIHAPQNHQLIIDASALLIIASILSLFDNFRIISYGVLRGLKDTRFPMYSSLISFWLIGLVSSYILAFHFHLAARGIWWGLTLGIAAGALILSIRLWYLFKHINLARIKTVPELK